MKSSRGVMDVFQGLDLLSGSDTFRRNQTTNQRDKGTKSELDDFFSVKEDISHYQARSNKLTPKKLLRTA